MNSELIQKINDAICAKHNKFLKSVGEVPYKLSADYVLLLVDTTTKITFMSSLLRENGVIDGWEVKNLGECNKFILYKRGLDFKVDILTNGISICLRKSNEMIDQNDSIAHEREWHYPSKGNGWNWEKFANSLLCFIHRSMYKSQESVEINFDVIMKGDV